MEFVGRSKVSMVVVVAAEKIPIGSSKLVSSVENLSGIIANCDRRALRGAVRAKGSEKKGGSRGKFVWR